MLDTLSYADLLAIHNALAEKPARRFDTRTNGERRTAALMEERGLTLEEAARLADVVLSDGDATGNASEPEDDGPEDIGPETGTERGLPDADTSAGSEDEADQRILVSANIAPIVHTFITELTKGERPAYLATFLRRMTGGTTNAPGTSTPRERQMTPSQRTIIALCERPEGATGKELAEGCGWPSIAARATCQKLADRFGYTLAESPKANGRGMSFRMTAKQSEG